MLLIDRYLQIFHCWYDAMRCWYRERRHAYRGNGAGLSLIEPSIGAIRSFSSLSLKCSRWGEAKKEAQVFTPIFQSRWVAFCLLSLASTLCKLRPSPLTFASPSGHPRDSGWAKIALKAKITCMSKPVKWSRNFLRLLCEFLQVKFPEQRGFFHLRPDALCWPFEYSHP